VFDAVCLHLADVKQRPRSRQGALISIFSYLLLIFCQGVTIHRPLIYGNTACLLTTEEKKNAPPDHTHRWTVAVRSAASAQGSDIVGGADDISYFIKRVTFKLHDTYPNPTRSMYAVTVTLSRFNVPL
jgi:hypothetical protein